MDHSLVLARWCLYVPLSNTLFSEPMIICHANVVSIGSAVFCRAVSCDQHKDHPSVRHYMHRYSPHLVMFAMLVMRVKIHELSLFTHRLTPAPYGVAWDCVRTELALLVGLRSNYNYESTND